MTSDASRRASVETAALVVIALCACLMAGLAVTRFLGAEHPPGPRDVKDWRTYAVGDMRIGPADAPVTITEFSDFQCPFCRRLFQTLQQVRDTRPGEIAIVFRNYPLSQLHPFARPAALAAQCAARQGKFPAFHDYLFTHQDSLGTLDWVSVAATSGVPDTASFRSCLASPATAGRLREDSAAAQRLGVRGTPTVMINGRLLPGAPMPAELDAEIEKALKRPPQPQ